MHNETEEAHAERMAKDRGHATLVAGDNKGKHWGPFITPRTEGTVPCVF